ncbi:hypothetical protein [Enterococcus mundtii]|uniref:hypothetical protein n=1 Tax=Enterococcus mundtii TaxID=53346 RepID=UPI001A960195|nr:hypothetical protein [Enterococcus mundtii]MBO1087231.1 hypothetical protein [Enterococcus mundtii]
MYRTAKYNVVNEELVPEVVHYETSGEQVKLFDKDMVELGNLQQLLMNGISLEEHEVDITAIKYSGNYIVNEIKNSPINNLDDKTSILQATAVGEKGNPMFVHFKLVHPTGQIFHNTVVGQQESGWTSSGKTLQEQLENSNNQIDINKKAISNHSTAITQLEKITKETSDNLSQHNHDGSYLKLSGGILEGNVSLRHGAKYKFVSSQGEEKDFAQYSVAKGATIGDVGTPMEFLSEGILKHNGKKVWSELSHGKGSGLDADLIQGVNGDDIAQLNRINYFKEDIRISKNKSLVFQDDGSGSGIFWRSTDGTQRAAIRVDTEGKYQFYSKDGKAHTKIERDGKLSTDKGLFLNASANETTAIFGLTENDKGMGMYRNNSSKYLGFYNWSKGTRMAYFHQDQNFLYLDEAPSIMGRRLYMQSGTPSGSRTVGDIWIS